MQRMKISLIVIILVLSSLAIAETSSLILSQSDIPSLKAKIEKPEFKDLWMAYLEKANDLCDPNSKSYADPNRVTKGFEDKVLHDPDDRPAFYGWRLQEQMQTLGLAYYVTGDQKFGDHGAKLFVNYAKEFAIAKEAKQKYAGSRGNMMRGLATGYDLFRSLLTKEQKEAVLDSLQGYVDNFLLEAEDTQTWWRPYHNYVGVCGGAAGYAALMLQDKDKKLSEAYVARITYLVKDWLWNGFDQQGAYYEGVGYSVYGLENVVIFADCLKRNGGEDLFQHPTFRKCIKWFAMSILPGDKAYDARNDSKYSLWHAPGDILLKFGSEFNSGVSNWLYALRDKSDIFLYMLWSNDVKPVSPRDAGMPLAEYFRGRGLCVWRTGWDTNDVMFAIEAGLYHVITHNQADKGSFTLYGFGYRWACDPGYGCNRDPNGRCQTVAHNCVLIDGKGQGLSGGSYGTSGKILAYDNNDIYGYCLADCTEAYQKYVTEANKIESSSGTSHFNMEMDHAYRHTFFVRKTSNNPAYAVILDDIAKDKAEHEYCWQMLGWSDLGINLTDPNMVVISPKEAKDSNSPKMFIFIDSDATVSLKQEDYKPSDNEEPAVYTRLRAYSKDVNPYFAAVLIPTDGSINAPKVNFEENSSEKNINIEWPQRIDKIVWKKDGKSRPQIEILNK